jgi:hypothetical protein
MLYVNSSGRVLMIPCSVASQSVVELEVVD